MGEDKKMSNDRRFAEQLRIKRHLIDALFYTHDFEEVKDILATTLTEFVMLLADARVHANQERMRADLLAEKLDKKSGSDA